MIRLLLHDPYEEMFDNLERMDTFYDDCHRARVFLQNLRNDASKAVKEPIEKVIIVRWLAHRRRRNSHMIIRETEKIALSSRLVDTGKEGRL